MRSRPTRLAAAVAGSLLMLGGCGTTNSALPSSKPSTVATTTIVDTTTPISTSTSTTFVQQAADQTHIANLLVGPANLPAGFSVAPDTQVGDDSNSLSLCGQHLTPVTGAAASAQVVVNRNGTQEQVVERLVTMGTIAAASAIVATVGQAATSCHSFDDTAGGKTVTMLVTPIQPPAIGEEVAGVQLATSARFVDVVVVRSGQVDALVVLSEVGNPVPVATMKAVVTAVGTRLVVGLGG